MPPDMEFEFDVEAGQEITLKVMPIELQLNGYIWERKDGIHEGCPADGNTSSPHWIKYRIEVRRNARRIVDRLE